MVGRQLKLSQWNAGIGYSSVQNRSPATFWVQLALGRSGRGGELIRVQPGANEKRTLVRFIANH